MSVIALAVGLVITVVYFNSQNAVQSLYVVDKIRTELAEQEHQAQELARRYLHISRSSQTAAETGVVLAVKGSGYVAKSYYQHDLGKTVFIVTDNHTRPWKVNKYVCPPIICKNTTRGPKINKTNHKPGSPQHIFFEGDIILDDELHQGIHRINRSTSAPEGASEGGKEGDSGRVGRRSIVRPVTRLWRYGIVPFVIDSNLNKKVQDLIHRAMALFSNSSCIKFVPRTNAHVDYIHYVNQPGCWSSVGRIGGEQYISMGEGCEVFGTVLHETAHSLGFWHEQSRPDRDEYVKIMTVNIDKGEEIQFTKRREQESTSHGYAYDYGSIMHYGAEYFSKAAEPTIKLIGVGERMNLRIGQRTHLSDLDSAQLNSMYYCNVKAAQERGCQDNWVKFRLSCYEFVSSEPETFFVASRACRQRKGRLVIIDDHEEDDFLKTHLRYQHADVERWRTGGVLLNESEGFQWYIAGDQNRDMKFTAWPPGQPITNRTALILERRLTPVNQTINITSSNVNTTDSINSTHSADNTTVGMNVKFIWTADWTGTTKEQRNLTYAFICEKPAKIECFKSAAGDGREYRGRLTYTFQGITCQRWDKFYPHNHTIALDPRQGIGDHNFCRNPRGRHKRPWCYTLLKRTNWQYCDVPICRGTNRTATG